MLKFENITVRRGERIVLSGIDFCLRPHRLTAVLGKNGCGKSTLVSCVTGQVKYTGDILLVRINYDKKEKVHRCVIEKWFPLCI